MNTDSKVNNLILTIGNILIGTGQNDRQKFAWGEIIRYSPSEIMTILKNHSYELKGYVVNQPEIIFCKDCIYGQERNDRLQRICEMSYDWAVLDKDFCSKAERKENA